MRIEIDWSKILEEHVQTPDSEAIEETARCGIMGGKYYSYQHMNWAYKYLGINRFARETVTPTTEDAAILIFACQKALKEVGLE